MWTWSPAASRGAAACAASAAGRSTRNKRGFHGSTFERALSDKGRPGADEGIRGQEPHGGAEERKDLDQYRSRRSDPKRQIDGRRGGRADPDRRPEARSHEGHKID